ncbi:MAG: Gfo/Idh/MocA family oxidoreductase [Balneolales bacterium]
MKKSGINRRDFIKKTTAAGMAASFVPSNVLGRSGHTPPSDKLNIGLIGFGSQSLKMLPDWLKRPELQFTSVCDPNKESYDYPQWGAPNGELWGTPGGREVGRKLINGYYEQKYGKAAYNGCTAYADFRDLLENENDLDAVFVMTPDHLHATIATAAMKKNLMVGSHKPIGNFMKETRITCETAQETGMPTQLFAFRDQEENHHIHEWIHQGVIGKVYELHRWTNRPMWPQGTPYLPENTPPVPDGFDWDLWLGPSLPRTYSPDYTHTVFRGWHEFGGGCLADMGYYGLWTDWRVLNLGMPQIAEASANVVCDVREYRSGWVRNTVSFPQAATIQWEVPVKDSNEMIDVFWYEGGLRPITPKALGREEKKLPAEGVMYVGEDGIIVADYNYGNPRIHGVDNADEIAATLKAPDINLIDYTDEMINYFKGGKIPGEITLILRLLRKPFVLEIWRSERIRPTERTNV